MSSVCFVKSSILLGRLPAYYRRLRACTLRLMVESIGLCIGVNDQVAS